MSPAKALRLSLAKSADELLELALVVRDSAVDVVPADRLKEHFSDDMLLILTDGPERCVGVVAMDLAATSALVEQNTMGYVSHSEPDARKPTSTDAALMAPFLDDIFLRVSMMLEGDRESWWLTGFHYGSRIENLRLMGLALDAAEFTVFRLEVEFGGVRSGFIRMAFPERPRPRDILGHDEGEDQGRTLGEAVMTAPAAISAVLHRTRMPLRDMSRLKVGDLIPVPRAALGETRLETLGEEGRPHCIGHVKLGQMNGFRAVRLTMAGLAEARSLLSGGDDGPGEGFSGADWSASDSSEAESGLPDLPMSPAFDPEPDPEPEMEMEEPPAMAPMAFDDLPDLSDLPELGGEGDDFPAMSLAPLGDLPDLE
ncbi:FliM/FliN family flagellar motor switch protein [Pseudooceanicola sp. CBS1P-1]|nr:MULTISPECIES: flagellar motor switch protein FliM [Pseudooceanicola]MBT9385523.1 FliM/FliN family flagellar motor switch protein [Pseudooceanicola endophyticus]